MAAIVYGELEPDEARLLGTIDRSERIDGVYRVSHGSLELDEALQDVPTWSGSELDGYVARLQALPESGGQIVGAWDGDQLVGVASLDTAGVGGERTVMKLDMLYVSSGHRGRGIGRALTAEVARRARSLGARSLYVSATPTRRTVEAYLRMGARVLRTPDPALFALEPEDIHLVIDLTET